MSLDMQILWQKSTLKAAGLFIQQPLGVY